MNSSGQSLVTAPPGGGESEGMAASPEPRQAMAIAERPAISVVIPVRNDPTNLELCLRALEASEQPAAEIIVVDDASTDETVDVARGFGVQLIRQEQQAGPAAARNRGAEAASYPYLYFLDADVCVHPKTLGRVMAKFESDPSAEAFFGSYDTRPGAPNFLSQYRNLLHHYVHQVGKKQASTFWSGCGAIKRSVFLASGGFDTGFSNASIEDIELGSRLREAGHRIELVKSIQVQHLKRWDFWWMVRTDIRNRALPWTRLVLRQGKIPNDLNLKYSQRVAALLAACLAVILALASWFDPRMLLIPGLAILAPLAIDRWTAHRPLPNWARWTGGVAVVVLLGALLFSLAVGYVRLPLWSLPALVCLIGIVSINLGFYRFLLQVKHPMFAALVLPLHVLYYLYSSAAFAVGLALHLGRRPRADPG